MIEVIVYLSEDYSINESIWVDKKLSKQEITKIIDSKFKKWYYYILNTKLIGMRNSTFLRHLMRLKTFAFLLFLSFFICIYILYIVHIL